MKREEPPRVASDPVDDLCRLHPALADRDRLQRVIIEAHLIACDGGLVYNEEEALKTLPDNRYEIEVPLKRVIDLLKSEGNRPRFLTGTGLSVKRYDALLSDLDEIRRVVPPPPKRKRRKGSTPSPKGKRGRPPTPRHTQQVIKYLGDAWEEMTGEAFQQGKGKSARFVRIIVNHVAPEHLGRIPKVASTIIAQRNKAISFNRAK